jgi:hypothetical protein
VTPLIASSRIACMGEIIDPFVASEWRQAATAHCEL